MSEQQQISWDAFAEFLADVADRHGLDAIIDGGPSSDDVSAMTSFASLDCAVFYLPVVAADGEIKSIVEQRCSMVGLQFLAMRYFDEYVEAIVIVRGTGDDVQQRIESLVDESDWPASSSDQTREPSQQPIKNDSPSQRETATTERATINHVSWDNFATFLAGIEQRHGLWHMLNNSEDLDLFAPDQMESENAGALTVIEPCDCIAFGVPHSIVEGDDIEPAMRQLCSTHGLQFLAATYMDDVAEALVVVAGTGHDVQRNVESLLDESDVDWDAFKKENKSASIPVHEQSR